MGDFIPPEELERFLASCNDASAQRTAREAAERARIQADNVGHKLLSKMGWKEGIFQFYIPYSSWYCSIQKIRRL